MQKHEWIPVSERTPKPYKNVLIWTPEDHIPYVGYIDRAGLWNENVCDQNINVSHWMEIQEP